MTAKPFPGFPEGLNIFISQKIFDCSLALAGRGNKKSEDLSIVYQGLALALLAPRTYFDLFMNLRKPYPAMVKFWSEIQKKNAGQAMNIGSGLPVIETENVQDLDLSIMNQMDPEAINHLMAMMSMTKSENAKRSPGYNQNMEEQFGILNEIFWAIYIGLFQEEFFQSNLRIFGQALEQAQKELDEIKKSQQN